jgi:O-antigen/teichoic acid export membrane protein
VQDIQLNQLVRTRSRAAITTFSANAINVLIVGAQGVLLIPLYLNAVGPHLYGAWLASSEVLVWLQAMDLGIPNLMIQRIASAYGANDRRRAADWFAAGILVLALVSVVIGLAGVAVSLLLPGWIGATPDESTVLSSCFLVGTVATCVTIFANGFVGLARAIQDTLLLSATLIASAVVGLLTSLTLLLAGFGLWAIALGLAARAGVGLVGALLFGIHAWRADLRGPFRIDRGIVTELLTASPLTALGGISYALMSQSEIVLVAVIVRPELAVVYALTRRAADLGRSLVDMIGFATYGGVAHLISSPDGPTARITYARILGLHLSCSVAVASAYLAVNRSLLEVWIGPSLAGGIGLIVVMAIQSIVLGHSYLINLLYRATGRVLEGSLALVIEALVRIPLLAIFLLAIGLPGLPIAATATAITAAFLIRRRTVRELESEHSRAPTAALSVWLLRALFLGLGVTFAVTISVPEWSYVLITGLVITLGGCLALLAFDPMLRLPLRSATKQFIQIVTLARWHA